LRLFSERKRIKKPRTTIQLDSMDHELRNGLWDMVTSYYLFKLRGSYVDAVPEIRDLVFLIWHEYFKKPIDTVADWGTKDYAQIREYFFGCPWNEVYDFIQFVANRYNGADSEQVNQDFMNACNVVLERDFSAYRFIGGYVTEITSKEEIASIEETLSLSDPLTPVRKHIETALALFSNKKSPDYRNSIKESISAVEAMCKIITHDNKSTLGKALDLIEKQGKIPLHQSLKEAFQRLYGYTSDAQGIRHAMLDETTLGSEDAKFMLISCSAFVNYLTLKTTKAGITL
jgi:hypothetical protein